LKLNDCGINRFLVVVSVFQLIVLGLFLLAMNGVNLPFLTPLVGLLEALFLPGLIILRILRLHHLDFSRVILYSVGLSIAYLMALGLFMNSVYPLLGIERPLDAVPSVLTVIISIFILGAVAYIRDRKYTEVRGIKRSFEMSPTIVFLLLLPVLAVLGTMMVNADRGNIVLMCLMLLLAAVPIMGFSKKWLPENLYPMAVLAVALALVWHRSLISNYLWGADILGEFACFRTVLQNGVWSSTTANLIPAYNATLSVTVFPAMLSNMLQVDGLLIFKWVFPVVLALVPLVMYTTLKTQFSARTALLSAFMVMALYTFYTTFLGTEKQLIATLFLSLFLLAVTDKKLTSANRVIMPSVFGLGVVVSHYSTAFLLAVTIPAALVIIAVIRRRIQASLLIVAVIVLLAAVSWYWFNANGAAVKQFVGMGDTALTAQTAVIDNATQGHLAESHRLIAEGSSNMPSTLRYLYLFTQGLIVIGAAVNFNRWFVKRDDTLSDEFMAFSVLFAGLLFLELVLPQFSLVISLDRIYLVCLLVLSPFCIAGLGICLRTIRTIASLDLLKDRHHLFRSVTSMSSRSWDGRLVTGIFIPFLAVFLLANTGFLYELAGKPLPTSIALSKNGADFPVFNAAEFAGAGWLLEQTDENTVDPIYYDNGSHELFTNIDIAGEMAGITAGHILYRPEDSLTSVATDVPSESYVFYRYFNLRTGELALGWPAYQTMDVRPIDIDSLDSFSEVLAGSNVIYQNGSSRIAYTKTGYSVTGE